MPTEPAHPLHVSRVSVIAALAACGIFLFLGLFVGQAPKLAQPDLTEAPEADQWRFTPEGRAAKLAEFQAREAAVIGSYAWIDKPAGILHLPIDRAMELTLQEANSRR